MEPMALGSPPSSPSSPSANPNFLPAFLIGDSQPNNPTSPSLSPGRNRNISVGRNTPGITNGNIRQKLFNQSLADSSFGQTAFPSPRSEKSGPPKQGLFDSLESNTKPGPVLSSTMQGYVEMPSLTPNDSFSRIGNETLDYSRTVNNLNESLNRSHKPVLLNTKSDDLWVTVFGFPPSAASVILTHFSQCGTIIDKKFPTQGNWVHIKYNSVQEVGKALAYNGKLITGTIMVGVLPFHNKQENKENYNSVITSPIRARSLRHSYVTPQNPNTVIPSHNVPQKSTGLVTKAMEYVFGW